MNGRTTQPRIADEVSIRRECARDCRCRWATHGIKTEGYWHSAGGILNLLRSLGRFDAQEIDPQRFEFRDKLRPPDNTGNFKLARFGNRDQTSRNLGIGCIQYDPISRLQLHKSVQEKNGRCWIDVQHRGRFRIDGWRNNEKAVGRSKDFLGPGKGAKWNRNPVPYLDVGDSWPNRLDDSCPFTSNDRRELR